MNKLLGINKLDIAAGIATQNNASKPFVEITLHTDEEGTIIAEIFEPDEAMSIAQGLMKAAQSALMKAAEKELHNAKENNISSES